MRYRDLGRSGIRVSEVSLGTGGQFGLLGEETTKLPPAFGTATNQGRAYS